MNWLIFILPNLLPFVVLANDKTSHSKRHVDYAEGDENQELQFPETRDRMNLGNNNDFFGDQNQELQVPETRDRMNLGNNHDFFGDENQELQFPETRNRMNLGNNHHFFGDENQELQFPETRNQMSLGNNNDFFGKSNQKREFLKKNLVHLQQLNTKLAEKKLNIMKNLYPSFPEQSAEEMDVKDRNADGADSTADSSEEKESTVPATEKPTEKATKKPAEKTTKKPAEKTTEKPAEKTTKKPAEKTTKKAENKNNDSPGGDLLTNAIDEGVNTKKKLIERIKGLKNNTIYALSGWLQNLIGGGSPSTKKVVKETQSPENSHDGAPGGENAPDVSQVENSEQGSENSPDRASYVENAHDISQRKKYSSQVSDSVRGIHKHSNGAIEPDDFSVNVNVHFG